CRRLAALPAQLVAATDAGADVAALRQAAADGQLSKFFDVNLTQVITDAPLRDTVEIRILPGSIDADEIVHQAALVELLLDRCLEEQPFPDPPADRAAAADGLLSVAAAMLARRTEPDCRANRPRSPRRRRPPRNAPQTPVSPSVKTPSRLAGMADLGDPKTALHHYLH